MSLISDLSFAPYFGHTTGIIAVVTELLGDEMRYKNRLKVSSLSLFLFLFDFVFLNATWQAIVGLKYSIANDSKITAKVTNADLNSIFMTVETVLDVHGCLYKGWEGADQMPGDAAALKIVDHFLSMWDQVGEFIFCVLSIFKKLLYDRLVEYFFKLFFSYFFKFFF